MLETDVVKRYAQALFELSSNSRELERELMVITEVFSSPEIQIFFESPRFKVSFKKKVLQQSLKGKVSNITFNFVNLLIDKNREYFLKQIIENLRDLNDSKFGKIKVNMKIARQVDLNPLIIKVQETIIENASKFGYPEGSIKEIEVTSQVKPDILAGAIIQVGDHVWDGSVSTYLEKWKENIHQSPIKQSELISGEKS